MSAPNIGQRIAAFVSKYPGQTASFATGSLSLVSAMGAASWVVEDARLGRKDQKADLVQVENNLRRDIAKFDNHLRKDMAELERNLKADIAKLKEFVGNRVDELHEENMLTQTLVLRVKMKAMKAIDEERQEIREFVGNAEKLLKCVKLDEESVKSLETMAVEKRY